MPLRIQQGLANGRLPGIGFGEPQSSLPAHRRIGQVASALHLTGDLRQHLLQTRRKLQLGQPLTLVQAGLHKSAQHTSKQHGSQHHGHHQLHQRETRQLAPYRHGLTPAS